MQEVDICINGLWIFGVKFRFRPDERWITVYSENRDAIAFITQIPIDKYYFKFMDLDGKTKSYLIKNREKEKE